MSTTTSANAWGMPMMAAVEAEVVSSTKQPSLQEIMDEEFARQLFEEECRAVQDEECGEEKPSLTNAFAGLSVRHDSRELLSADSCLDAEDEGDGGLSAWGPKAAATNDGMKTKPQHFDRSLPFEGGGNGVFNGIRESFRKWDKDTRHGTGGGRVEASKFATRDRVMDEKTTLLMQKLINRGDLDEIHGCIQTGKEANVYHALGTDEETLLQREYAVKIFKSTLSEFSNRSEYVLGDGRFDLAYNKKSAQRQLREWTEKEFRNLCRAAKHVRVPSPITFKEHILVMTFIGKDGWSAPTLKEATLSRKQLVDAYLDVLKAVRTLYHDAKLVHGDLSEYNILYHNHQCWLIDFGQAVDSHHPEFFTFLQRDLLNLRQFFERSGVPEATQGEAGVLPDGTAFEFVTSEDPAQPLEQYPPLHQALLPSPPPTTS